ncbi:MAG: toll/interleukin-1 receptor domain-containing protein, partial [Bacteroidota bacterium]|nr:toll/interleukin-1 receptor domain-containing protein [Bacteroidota bacterium]
MKRYDVFISYAIEDKTDIAEKLALLLGQRGIKVYYAGNELSIGSRVSEVIYEGLRKSRFVILVMSPAYTRHWPAIERSNFIEKEQKKNQLLIFPIRHNITHEEISEKYPGLADRWGLSTSIGMENLADRLFIAIKKKKKKDYFKTILKLSVIIVLSIVFLSPGVLFYREKKKSSALPSEEMVKSVVSQHVKKFQGELDNELKKQIAKSRGTPSSFRTMVEDYNLFLRIDAFERNEYQFTSEWCYTSGRKRLEELGIPLSETPYQAYGISFPDIYLFEKVNQTHPKLKFISVYAFSNERGTTFEIDTIFRLEGEAHAIIRYGQNIRVVYNTLK